MRNSHRLRVLPTFTPEKLQESCFYRRLAEPTKSGVANGWIDRKFLFLPNPCVVCVSNHLFIYLITVVIVPCAHMCQLDNKIFYASSGL